MKSTQLNILLLLLVMVNVSGCGVPQRLAEEKEFKERLSIAQAMFDEHCKKSGVTIHKTLSDVEGVFLMKIRPEKINFGKQFSMDDPYGRDLGGDGYIKMFLRGNYEASRRGGIKIIKPKGFLYVESIDPQDDQRYRYTGSVKVVGQQDRTTHNNQVSLKENPNFDLNKYDYVLDKVPAPGKHPRYGVTYDDISTHKDREYWIAGSSLRVIDLKTNEVLAERIGYMMDYGQGSRSGGRSQWLMAANNACPEFASRHGASAQLRQTQFFVEQVLFPKMEY